MKFLDFAPILHISAKTGERAPKLLETIEKVSAARNTRVPTGELNRLVEQIKAKQNPPSQKGKHAKILYATQTDTRPTTFVFFVNQVRLFHFSYVRFIENQLREAYGFKGVPIKLELREEKPK